MVGWRASQSRDLAKVRHVTGAQRDKNKTNKKGYWKHEERRDRAERGRAREEGDLPASDSRANPAASSLRWPGYRECSTQGRQRSRPPPAEPPSAGDPCGVRGFCNILCRSGQHAWIPLPQNWHLPGTCCDLNHRERQRQRDITI